MVYSKISILLIITVVLSLIGTIRPGSAQAEETILYLMSPDTGTTKTLTPTAVDTTGSITQGISATDWVNFTSEGLVSGEYTDNYYDCAIFMRNLTNNQQVNITIFTLHSGSPDMREASWIKNVNTSTFSKYTDTYTASGPDPIQAGDRLRLSIKAFEAGGVEIAYNSTTYPSYVNVSVINMVFPELNSVIMTGLITTGIVIGAITIIQKPFFKSQPKMK
ncbi:MAG: hypothetical protein ACFFCQ_04910 [Promethearchaeota archaeon]